MIGWSINLSWHVLIVELLMVIRVDLSTQDIDPDHTRELKRI